MLGVYKGGYAGCVPGRPCWVCTREAMLGMYTLYIGRYTLPWYIPPYTTLGIPTILPTMVYHCTSPTRSEAGLRRSPGLKTGI